MSSSVNKIEKSLLVGQWDNSIDNCASPICDLARKVVQGELKDVLTSELAGSLLNIHVSEDDLLGNPLEAWFTFQGPEDLSVEEAELLRIVVGTACLHAFLQVNWTGPDLNITPIDVLLKPPGLFALGDGVSGEALNRKAIAELAYGGEPAYHLAQSATFLRVAQLLFDYSFTSCRSAVWWRLRTARIHQHVLDEAVPVPSSLTEPLEDLYSSIASPENDTTIGRDLAGRLALEHGLMAHRTGQDKLAAELFVRAARYTGLEYELTGALGKRTKFQQTELSQLVLLAESRERRGGRGENAARAGAEGRGSVANADGDGGGDLESGAKDSSSRADASDDASVLPETLALGDDTLLERTQFTNSSDGGGAGASGSKLGHLDPSNQPPLHPLDQCILLSLCLNVKNTSPAHGLTIEQMKPYVERVILHPRNWSVHTMALLLRSRLEAERTRTVERSVLQLQALVDQMPTADSTLPERLLYIHYLPMPSKWEIERELALRFLTLGVVRSALEIFERLEMWEEAVKCWQSLERPERGIAIVRDLLEGKKEESESVMLRGKAINERRRLALDAAREAKLWCLLGDLEPRDAVEHYTHAWEVSGHKSGRAMRSLGGYYYSHGEFTKAIECLRKGAAINPLLSRPWFILGCACVREERWEEARDAFARCVSIDDEDGESWNNLATVYLHMGSTAGADETDQEEDDHTEEVKTNGKSSSRGSVPLSNKLLAFRALQIGLKHSYDNWRMWMNYMVVAMDVGEFAEAARAQARVVEERAAKDGAEAVDEDVLDRLVDAVARAPDRNKDDVVPGPEGDTNDRANSAVTNRSPNEGEGLRPRVLDLFERVVLPRVSSQRIYRAYGRLLASQERWVDALKYYLDAYRLSSAAKMEKGDAVDRASWLEALSEVEEIVDILRNFGSRADDQDNGTEGNEGSVQVQEGSTRPGKWRMQARSIVRSFMARTRDSFEDDPDWSKLTELIDELKQ